MNQTDIIQRVSAARDIMHANLVRIKSEPVRTTFTEAQAILDELLVTLAVKHVVTDRPAVAFVEDQANAAQGVACATPQGEGGGPPLAPGQGSAAAVLPMADQTVSTALLAGMQAVDKKWNNRLQTWEDFPDHRIRLDYIKTYLGYRIGMPAQMIVKIDAGYRDQAAEMVELAKTPLGRRLLLGAGAIDEQWLAKNLPDGSHR